MVDNLFIFSSDRIEMTKKRLLTIILSIVLLLALIDAGMGWCMRWYILHKNIPGDYGKIEYMLKHADVQILLLGASTCMNSIDPEVLEKELGMSVPVHRVGHPGRAPDRGGGHRGVQRVDPLVRSRTHGTETGRRIPKKVGLPGE